MSTDLAAWLLEQIAEDEDLAQRCPRLNFSITDYPSRPGLFEVEAYSSTSMDRFDEIVIAEGGWRGIREPYAQHIARWDPYRALAEIGAKRRIIEDHHTDDYPFGEVHQPPTCLACENEAWPCRTLKFLALPYAGHAGYREEWRPAP